MKMKRDVFWKYFESFRLRGEDIHFTLVRSTPHSILERITFDHRFYDGISAICEYSREKRLRLTSLPTLLTTQEPHFFRKFFQLLSWYKHIFPGLAREWNRDGQSCIQVGARECIDKDSWRKIQKIKPGTVAVLEALDQVSLKYLKPSNLPRIWMIPVGLYPSIDLQVPPSNRVSFVDIKLKASTQTHLEIKTQLKNFLSKGQYWGNVYSIYIVHLLGVKLFSLLLTFLPYFFRKTGTLTNVGQWTIDQLPENEYWSIDVTVVKISPLGASMLEINGQLGLGIQFHPSLGVSQEMADTFVKEWKELLLNQLH